MPYKFEHTKEKIPSILDRRRKLSQEDRATIRRLYKKGLSIRGISRIYKKVCRRSIQFVLFPERLKTVNYPGHWKKYYQRKKHAEAMKKHRTYKQTLAKKGSLKKARHA